MGGAEGGCIGDVGGAEGGCIGGQDGGGSEMSTVERFDPRAGRWEEVAPMGAERYLFAAAVL